MKNSPKLNGFNDPRGPGAGVGGKPGFESTMNLEFCTCGNPSKEGYVHFEDDEDLIYMCVDCHKQVDPNSIKDDDDDNS